MEGEKRKKNDLKDLLTLKVQWRNEFHKNICRKLKLR
jgi:hypothetical protein